MKIVRILCVKYIIYCILEFTIKKQFYFRKSFMLKRALLKQKEGLARFYLSDAEVLGSPYEKDGEFSGVRLSQFIKMLMF